MIPYPPIPYGGEVPQQDQYVLRISSFHYLQSLVECCFLLHSPTLELKWQRVKNEFSYEAAETRDWLLPYEMFGLEDSLVMSQWLQKCTGTAECNFIVGKVSVSQHEVKRPCKMFREVCSNFLQWVLVQIIENHWPPTDETHTNIQWIVDVSKWKL